MGLQSPKCFKLTNSYINQKDPNLLRANMATLKTTLIIQNVMVLYYKLCISFHAKQFKDKCAWV